MMMLLRRVHVRGFTLIELLVVIAIIAILAAILVPAVTDALLRGRLTQMMANGRNIYTALFAKDMEDAVLMKAPPYPFSGPLNAANRLFPDSTEYFRWVVTSGVLNVEFSFFAGPSVPPAQTLDAALFLPENNAWCISSGITADTSDGAPILFTRNLVVENTSDSLADMGTVMPKVYNGRDNVPFGDKAMVVTHKGGASYALRARDVPDNFNKASVTNIVLRPSGDY